MLPEKNIPELSLSSNTNIKVIFDSPNEELEMYSEIYVFDSFQRRLLVYNGLLRYRPSFGNESSDGADKNEQKNVSQELRRNCPSEKFSSNRVVNACANNNKLGKTVPSGLCNFLEFFNARNAKFPNRSSFYEEAIPSSFNCPEISNLDAPLSDGYIDDVSEKDDPTFIELTTINVANLEKNVDKENMAGSEMNSDSLMQFNTSMDVVHSDMLQIKNTYSLAADSDIYSEKLDKEFSAYNSMSILTKTLGNNNVSVIPIPKASHTSKHDENSYPYYEADPNTSTVEYYDSRNNLFDARFDYSNEVSLSDALLEDSYSMDSCLDLETDLDGKRERIRNSLKALDCDCSKCGKTCRSLNALNHHMLVHSDDRPYVCGICKKAFKEQPTLRRHMCTHMEKQHQCDICKKYFVEKSSLRRHMSTIHADFKPGTKTVQVNQKQYACSRCGKLFKSMTKFNLHVQMHGNPNYECEVCGKVYAGRSHLKIHQRIHTGEKPFVCNMCGAKFAFKHVLKSHQARIHQRVSKYKCNLCRLTFVDKSDLSDHVSFHYPNIKKGKRLQTMQKYTKTFNNMDEKKLYQKNVLKLRIGASQDLDYGLFGQLVDISPEKSEAGNDENVDVEVHQDAVATANSLIETHHVPKSEVVINPDPDKHDKKCLKCSKVFERMGDLKRHIISHIVQDFAERAASGDKPLTSYECGICHTGGFRQVDKFKAHLREHANLKLYKCQFCQRAFADSSNYSKHKKVHGNKFLQCDICRRKFNTKRMLISHMDYHKFNQPKTCDHCDKVFHFESNMRKHMKMSHQGKASVTFKCEYCESRFCTVKEKWEHQWDDHQVRKVQADCGLCGQKFRKISLLRAHMMREHIDIMCSR